MARIFRWGYVRAWENRYEVLSHEQRVAGDAKATLDLVHADLENALREARKWQENHTEALQKTDKAFARAIGSSGDALPSVAHCDRTIAQARRSLEDATKTKQECEELKESAQRTFANSRSRLNANKNEIKTNFAALRDLGVTDAQREYWDLRSVNDNTRQLRAPWYDEALWTLRHEAFIAALDLHKTFLRANIVQVTDTLQFVSKVMTGAESQWGTGIPMQYLWDTLFLVVPVVSTTFAALPRMFAPLGKEAIGWLIIDEAGQATPQAALGSIWRARRSVVVGDPLQIEPVVPMPEAAVEMIRQKFDVGHQWHPVANSAQVLADRANQWGIYLEDDAKGPWLGSPLRVHRRCVDPMFSVANQIAYGGMMVYGTKDDDKEEVWLGQSAWIDIGSDGAEGHWIPAQGDVAARIVHAAIARKGSAFRDDGKANIYVISPFKAAADGIRALLLDRRSQSPAAADAAKHVRHIAGTVHTFQGREADIVVLMLCGDPAKSGARSGFAARAPNLLNVALTRAKRRIYVVGDHSLWSKEKYFNVLAANVRRVQPKAHAAS